MSPYSSSSCVCQLGSQYTSGGAIGVGRKEEGERGERERGERERERKGRKEKRSIGEGEERREGERLPKANLYRLYV